MLKPNPKRHPHQCGRVMNGWLEGYGCGTLWFHQRDTSLSIVDDHKCPMCGAGPWYYELSQEEVESAAVHPRPSPRAEPPTLD